MCDVSYRPPTRPPPNRTGPPTGEDTVRATGTRPGGPRKKGVLRHCTPTPKVPGFLVTLECGALKWWAGGGVFPSWPVVPCVTNTRRLRQSPRGDAATAPRRGPSPPPPSRGPTPTWPCLPRRRPLEGGRHWPLSFFRVRRGCVRSPSSVRSNTEHSWPCLALSAPASFVLHEPSVAGTKAQRWPWGKQSCSFSVMLRAPRRSHAPFSKRSGVNPVPVRRNSVLGGRHTPPLLRAPCFLLGF